ncbi:MAG TPA: FtsX-like permease family protein, partial [Gemmatimonadaceae bacterium]|nr:FtsX-like permease family protein [Gemmatimonadaceae bacterium]
TESLVLALGGAALGVAIAPAAVNALLRIHPDALPLVDRVGVDWTLLGVASAVAVATGLLFGVVPALQLSRGDVHAVLKEGGRGSGAGGERGRRTRRTLVAAQLALAVVVAAAAGLLTRSFDRLTSVDPGFQPRGVLTAQVPLPRGSYQSDTAAMAFFRQLIPRLAATPGVQAVGIVGNLPLGGGGGNWDVDVEGRTTTPGEAPVSPNVQFVGGDYFRAIGMRARRGRPLGPEDDEGAPLAAVINEAMARMLWPGQSPLGARFRVAGPPGERWMTVVGVMNDVRQASLRDTTRGEYYIPHAQMHRSTGFTPREMYVVARASGDPAALAPTLRRILRELDPAVAPSAVRTLREVVERSVAQPRLTMLLVAGFGVLALVIAAVGVYGVTAYTVARRRTEMAVRLALGARPADVVRLVVRQGMGVAAAGIAVGIVGALAASRVMRSMVFGVSPTDPATYAAIAAVLLGVALVATWLPALRTTTVDPASTLRAE